jgi:hypothetical protein
MNDFSGDLQYKIPTVKICKTEKDETTTIVELRLHSGRNCDDIRFFRSKKK